MFRRTYLCLTILCTLVFLISLGVASLPAHAAAVYTLNYSNFTGGGCDASGFSSGATGTFDFATPVTIQGEGRLNGAPHDTYSFGFPAGAGTFGTGFGRSFFPALASSTYTFQFRSSVLLADGTLVWTVVVDFTCDNGVLSASSRGFNAFFEGAYIPAGFVLRTINCDVAVYDSAGGSPVGSNAITSGQTWFVNATPVKAADGTLWTEIFVSGFNNGFIPTSCVGGYPSTAPSGGK